MAISSPKFNIDLAGLGEQVSSQFRYLNPREPGQWPILPKLVAWLLVVVAVVVVGWVLLLNSAGEDLDRALEREPKLKQEYRQKLSQAINLSELKKQKLQVQEYVTQLERQLPGKAEMDALLSDINQAGLGRGLQIEVFRPGQVEIKDYYAELPITVKVTGRYHDIGAFAADVANLSRIVTLHNLSIVSTTKDGSGYLSMDAVARTYRYLDPSEVIDLRKAASGAAKPGAKK
jgi:type IV pilus assembly protein PilO